MDTIKMHDLAVGDVLLYKGTSFISRAIQFFDGTDFSHAALYLGNGSVGEAVATGLERRPYVEGAAGIWVQAHRLKDSVPTMDPVMSVATAYLDQGNRYGYEQLLLLAFLCLTRKLKFTPSLRQLVRVVLDSAAAALTRLFSEHRQPMICSEFVYRVYDEALPGPDDVYSLWVNRLVAPGAAPLRAFSAEPAGMPPLAPARGQGIHPQSLLALLSSSSGSAWLGAPAVPAFAAEAEIESSVAELESLVETYLEEVRTGPPAAPRALAASEPTLEDLRAAAAAFAASFYASTHPEESQLRALSAPEMTALANAYLAQTAADFVTPGDLYTTQSLYLLGKVEL